ncbi:hypothetical protein MTF65_03710 [Streptomyces sp. APSN-46.1]|uniref:hypothetical protein n=1 Tax=Streptomyces sp. APSN-46.1 TaxID=2929049 RepID=UPI001FB38220|nr:hypothetical protein [Streptomyces sp. APSN-46.1]MCJ1676469.1 hypothetical protein [Streptomyces sp. APSN-46.1]
MAVSPSRVGTASIKNFPHGALRTGTVAAIGTAPAASAAPAAPPAPTAYNCSTGWFYRIRSFKPR